MTSLSNAKILLIGAGKMGSALLSAWLRSGMKPQSITVIEPNPPSVISGPVLFRSLDDVKITPDCIVLAVKPQSMDALLPTLSSFQRKLESQATPLYLSIAAGKTLPYFTKHLGDVPVVRAMPNTPALIGKGISVLCANNRVSDALKKLATLLLETAGEVVWIKDEALMNTVTAVSGSGPAYVFLFMEALIEAGKKHGLPEDVCKQLAMHTVAGSAELALASKEPLATLRKNVTSPGGTTEAALGVLMKDDALKSLLANAVAHAVKRSKELA